MRCTSCGTDCEAGVKYCVACGALLPLDEDSASYFASLFREEPWVDEGEPEEVDEADVDTAARPKVRSAMRAVPGAPTATRTAAPRRHKHAATGAETTSTRLDTEPMTPVAPPQRLMSDDLPTAVSAPVRQRPAALSPSTPESGPRGGAGKRSRALVIGAVTLMLVSVFGVWSLIVALRGSEASPVPTTVAIASQTTTAQVPTDLPSGALICADGVARNSSTSCEFAENVAAQVRKVGNLESFQISAYSPVTKKSYTMTCTRNNWTRCAGGVNAVVFVRS